MKNNEELNSIKNEIEALHKKLMELSMDDLEKVAGGNRTDFGAWLETDECFKEMNSGILYVYQGPAGFIPFSEYVPVDVYKPRTSEDGSVYYQFLISEQIQVVALASACDALGNKSTLPYELRGKK